MRSSPSIVPEHGEPDVYLVFDDFGRRLGRAWRETDEARTGREVLIEDLLECQYASPVKIVAFNIGEGWSRDATQDIADELRRRCATFPDCLQDFLERNPGYSEGQLRLRF